MRLVVSATFKNFFVIKHVRYQFAAIAKLPISHFLSTFLIFLWKCLIDMLKRKIEGEREKEKVREL